MLKNKGKTVFLVLLLCLLVVFAAACEDPAASDSAYTVRFMSNGGTTIEALTDIPGGTMIDEPEEPVRDGHTFLGWYRDVSMTIRWTFNKDKVTASISLYAKWILNSDLLTVTFDSKGGSAVASIERLVPDSKITSPASTKEDYTLSGWYLDEEFNEEFNFNTMAVTKNLTLYAKWVWNNGTHTVTFDTKGGDAAPFTVEADSGKPINAPEAPVRGGGFEFDGWYADAGCTQLWDFENDVVTAAVTIYAKWKAVTYYAPVKSGAEYELVTALTGESGKFEVLSVYNGKPVTAISKNAFSGRESGLTEIVIPDSVTAIPEGLFSGCLNLETITIPYVGASKSATAASAVLGYIFGRTEFAGADSVKQFYSASAFNEYFIPSSLRTVNVTGGAIGFGAFNNCAKIESVTLGNLVTTIGSDAFRGCSSLETVVIGEMVSAIGANAFKACTSLGEINIGASVATVGAEAFAECAALESIEFTDKVTGIGAGAFAGMQSLESISLPFVGASRTASGTNGLFGYVFGTTYFDNGKQITQNSSASATVSYFLPLSLRTVTLGGGGLGYGAFSGFSWLNTVTLPDGIASVGDAAFMNCAALTSIDLKSTTAVIGVNAFSGCSELTSVTGVEGVTRIGNGAFQNCEKLVSLSAHAKLREIGTDAFKNCKMLTAITLSAVTSIGTGAFASCVTLETIVIPGTVSVVSANAFAGCTGLNSVAIGSGVTEIGASAFAGCNNAGLNAVALPSTLTTIGESAFSGCGALSEIVIPSLVRSIGANAFRNCVGAETLTFETDVALTIGAGAFAGCNNPALRTISVPDKVTSIGDGAFAGCSALEEINLPFAGANGTATSASSATVFGYIFGSESFGGTVKTTQYYAATSFKDYFIPSNLKTVTIGGGAINYGTFDNCGTLQSITLTDRTSVIGVRAFRNCVSLAAITVPGSIAAISQEAFGGCTNLGSAVIGYGVVTIGVSAFAGCESLGSIHFPSSVTTISATAFAGCIGLTGVSVPVSVTGIGAGAFAGCTGIAGISLPFVGASASASSANGLFGYIFGTTQYAGCDLVNQYYSASGFASNYIPASITSVELKGGSIPQGAFYGCKRIETVTLPETIATIGVNAFMKCTALTGLTLPSSVTGIGAGAFDGCTGIREIVIPQTVTSIGAGAFRECTSMEKITLPFVGASKTVTNETSLFGYIFGTDFYAGSKSAVQNYKSSSSVLAKEYYIPATLNDVTVTSGRIGFGAFSACAWLIRVSLGAEVLAIDESAFKGCEGTTLFMSGSAAPVLASAALDSIKVAVVPNNGLENYRSAWSAYSSKIFAQANLVGGAFVVSGTRLVACYSNATELTVPSDIVIINQKAFYYCRNLETVTIPASVSLIYASAFEKCVKLSEVNIAGGTEQLEISERVFKDCESLEEIVVPDRVTRLGFDIFSGCQNLSSMVLPFAGNVAVGSHMGNLFGTVSYTNSYRVDSFFFPRDLSNITINGGAITIQAFKGMEYLTTVTLDAVSIGAQAFVGTGLTKVTLGENVASIGLGAFAGCTGITEIIIPDGVTSIGDSAFESTGITELILGDNVQTVGSKAFADCMITELTISGETSIASNSFDVLNVTTLTVTGAAINDEMFKDWTAIDSLTIGDSIITIGLGAFGGCTSITEIIIPDSVTSIGDSAFENTGITEIILGDNVQTVGSGAFAGCVITELTISGETVIESDSFDILNITTLTVTGAAINDEMFKDWTAIETLTLSGTIETIGDGAFKGCTGLTEVTIPDGVITIGNSAFEGCTGITEIIIPDSVTSIGDSAFANTGITEIILGNNVQTVGGGAFAGCVITDLTISGETVIESDSFDILNITTLTVTGAAINDEMFKDWTAIETLTLSGTIETIGDGAFKGCTVLTEVTIPDGVITIGNSAFEGCTGITEIVIPDSVTSIGDSAFANTGITTLTLGEGLETIGSSAFEGCGLTTLEIPASVTSIGVGAFKDNADLETVTILASADGETPITYDFVFDGCTALTAILVHDAVTEAYYETEWATALTALFPAINVEDIIQLID